jgi:hypothetical protein
LALGETLAGWTKRTMGQRTSVWAWSARAICGGFVVALLTFFREPVCCMILELFGENSFAIHASARWVLRLIAVRQHHILADLLQWDFSHGAGTVTLALSS